MTTAGPPQDEARYFFIRRPVMASVLSIVVVLLGSFAIKLLPVARYPQITPPAVTISTVYPGASAEDAAQAVAAPIEEQLSSLQGMLYFSSTSASDGSVSITITFDVSRDQDLAAVDVQNAEKLAEPQLPASVRTNGVTITKANTNILGVVALLSSDPRYDATYLSNYMKLNVVDEIKRVPGIGDATPFPNLDFSMLLQLNPSKMAQLGVTVNDVTAAVQEQNATNPAGRLGREPSPPGTQLTLPITTLGRLQNAEEFKDIIVRASPNGGIVRVRDIGDVVLGARSYDQEGRLNGTPSALSLMYTRPGANALDVKNGVVARMTELEKTFPKGITWKIPFDTTPFVTASIKEVIVTLAEAMLLVTLVVFLFLQSWRATLIPMLAVPVSVIGTFLGLYALHMSINVLTLFGLVLAIGIVVDDAIVVIENVERIMASEKIPARMAADKAIRQVASALIAIVLVLCSVFVPVAFIGGVKGELFKQFAVTIVIAVLLSGMVALTLTPALCGLLLTESSTHANTTGFFGWFNRTFARATNRYVKSVDGVLRRPSAWVGVFAVFIALTGFLWVRTPTAFIPTEDKGYMALSVQLPDAASLQRTKEVVARVEQALREEPAVVNIVALAGLDILAGRSAATNGATIFVNLKNWDERGPSDALDALAGRVNAKLAGIREASAFAFNLPEVPGLGATAGVEINLQNRAGMDIRDFAQRVNEFRTGAGQLAASGGLNSSFRSSVPQVFVTVNREEAKSRGVNLSDLFGTMQAFTSTLYINDFNLFGKTYRVQAEAQQPFRQKPEDIGRLYVRGNGGVMIPLSALTTQSFRSAPTVLQRFNGFVSAQFTGAPKPGRSTGELLDQVEGMVQTQFASAGIGVSYSGQSYQERVSSGDAALVFVLGLILVFLVLAAQYESWSVPFAVLLGVPFGVLGALLGIYIRGQPNDVYFQVGMIAVVGLAAKNAILIVEFANELRTHGMPIHEAAVEAARERIRPILMTSFAFILGVLPLMLASGAGAASRHSIGTGVFAGMLFATSIGIFFIPLFFQIIRTAAERTGRKSSANLSTVATILMCVALAGVVSACASGPSYSPTPAVRPEVQMHGSTSSDSTRAFFDSLAVARASDNVTSAHPAAPERALRFDTTAGVAWLDILHDTTLERLVQTAMTQNKTVQSAVARIREYRAEAASARTLFGPNIAINGNESTNQVAFGSTLIGYRAARLTGDMSWELDFWGKFRRGYEAANADAAAQDAAERAVLLSLVSDVATNYLQLLELDQERAIAERTLSSRRATLDLARQRFARGVISELDVRQFEAQVAAPAVTLAQVERQTAVTEHYLSVLLGEAPRSIERRGSLAAAASVLRVPDTLSASLLARRPDVQQAERAFAAATARIGATMASNLPTISITGSYGSQAGQPSGLFASGSTVYQLAAGFSFPLQALTRGRDETAAARARADQAKAAYEGAALCALRDANDALVGVRTSRDQMAALATQADALRHALELAELRYSSGLSSYLDVLDAQRNLFSAELGLSQGQLQQLTSAVELYKALGGSWKR